MTTAQRQQRGSDGRVRPLGVRHHGPGSARAVAAALDELCPDAVLIEGPPEADALLPLAADPAMRPPVALLAHVADDPGQAAFWPFAEFSPEWVALRWALRAGVPVRFVDLPAGRSFALEGEPESRDPIAELAHAAGHEDPESWWEDVVEHRVPVQALDHFAAVAEAMEALTGVHGRGRGSSRARAESATSLREAFMRQCVRGTLRQGSQRIAVVCGAWHVPALSLTRYTAAADAALLRGLPRVKVEITWVPWSYRRLGLHSGYGAGVPAPGWYQHLFAAPDRPVTRWMAKVADLLRAADHPVSPADVIEAVRLAEALAALRGRPVPGLEETSDAVRSVFCAGSEVPSALVRDRLVVGDALGEVPEAAPAVPLQRDLTRAQRALRLRPEADARDVELDLREPGGAARSRLLHRLRLLDVPWGEPLPGRSGGLGTFRECWRLRWEPEFSVRVAEAGTWGTTVESAATAKARHTAANTSSLAESTALAERCLLAGLPGALPVVLRVLGDRAALDTDVAHLAEALPALVRTLRYGDVRGTDAGAVRGLAESLAVRICVGLPPACTALDEDAAAEMRTHLDATHAALALLQQDADGNPASGGSAGGAGTAGNGASVGEGVRGLGGNGNPATGGGAGGAGGDGNAAAGGEDGAVLREQWVAALRAVARRAGAPGLLRGRAVRLLLEDGGQHLDAARELRLALTPAADPADAAGWIEGFLADSGLLLVHDPRLLTLLDDWLTTLTQDTFTDVLPLLRRTFAAFEPASRRALADRLRSGPPASTATAEAPLDPTRAAAVLPTLALLLGPGRVRSGPDGPPGSAVWETSMPGRSTAAPSSQRTGVAPSPGGDLPLPPSPAAAPPSAAAPSPAAAPPVPVSPGERLRRWRLVLGSAADGPGRRLGGRDAGMDAALAAVYREAEGGGRGGMGTSSPQVVRWLGDIRRYFPTSVVRLLQRDAIERLGLAQLLLEPETLAAVEPDVHLVGTLLGLGAALPESTRESARVVVRRVAEELERRLAARTRALVGGALDRGSRSRRPRPQDIDWQRTIRANLGHYLPEQRTLVPRRLVGHARAQRAAAKEVILCVDQSASMASSLVHAAVFASVLASLRGLRTRLVVFDTSVVDLTDQLADPVDVLFGVRLGGGTDIGRALAYCQSRVGRPEDTVLVLISDLYEGGAREELLRRAAALTASGVRLLALLALSDEGAPAYDRENAAALAELGVPAFACTPGRFPELMAAALQRRPLPLPEGTLREGARPEGPFPGGNLPAGTLPNPRHEGTLPVPEGPLASAAVPFPSAPR